MSIAQLSQTELLKILSGIECPFCEMVKLSGCMFCDDCWNKLTLAIKLKIHNALRSLSENLKDGIELLEK